MPELPEVEAARRAVEHHCKGGLICRAVVADDTTVVEGMLPFDMQRSLVGKRIVAAHRKGKQLWIQMDEPLCINFQFGMAGAVYIKGVKGTQYVRSAVKDEDEWPSKYSKVLLVLDSGVEMSFTDKRRFARVRLLKDPSTSSPIKELGPDAFTELPREDVFAESLSKKKTPIKALLLDQSFLAGIGNWIADEVLYQSRIHPEQPASSLSGEDCKRLRNSIREVIKTAVDAEADSAEYPQDWITHHREKKKSASVNGKEIKFITVGGRTSAYVPELQQFIGTPKKKPVSRRKKKAAKEEEEEEEEEDDDEENENDGETESETESPKAKGKAATRKKGQAKAPSAEEVQEAKPRRGRSSKAKEEVQDLHVHSSYEGSKVVGFECSGGLVWPRTRSGAQFLSGVETPRLGELPVYGVISSLCNQSLGRVLVAAPREETRFGLRLLSYVLRKSVCFI